MLDLSIIIVSWNTQVLVRQCLLSLRKSSCGLRAETIVVDNASSDGTPEMIALEFPEVILIRNRENLGFARANNIGLKIAKGRYVALINSDVTVLQDCLQSLIRYLDNHGSVGLSGPRMLTPAGVASSSCMRQPTLAIFIAHALGLASFFKRFALHLTNAGSTAVQEVDVLNGWFWVARRSALEEVGLLDERFFMYGEDIEWCGRFRKNGWKVVFCPKASAIHYGGGSSKRDPVRFYLELNRARLQYWKLGHGFPSSAVYLAILTLHQMLRLLGYGLVYSLGGRSAGQTLLKIKRSAVCLQWLITGARARTVGAQ
jgi:GT2 family glycosyltransferase